MRQRSILFGALFFLIALTPVYGLVPLFNQFMERYLYLPVAGFVMSAVYIASFIAQKLKIRPEYLNRYMPIFALVVLILFSFSVVKRNPDWKDSYYLWSDTAGKMPDSYRAYHNLGIAYFDQGHYDEAIKEYLTAIRLKPDYAQAYYNVGLAYRRQGRYDEAINELSIASKLQPDFIEAYHSLKMLMEKEKGYKNAGSRPR